MTPVIPRNLRSLAIFTTLYIIAAAISAELTNNTEFIFYLGVMIVTIAGTMFIHHRVRLPIPLLWCLSIWGLLHMMGGMVPASGTWQTTGHINVLYNLWLIPGYLRYDQLIHAYGFAITAWLCWECLSYIVRSYSQANLAPTFGALTLCVFASNGLGALNEVIEFMATLLFAETNVGDYTNMSWDLVFNLIGSIIAAVIIRIKKSAYLKLLANNSHSGDKSIVY